MEKNKKMTPCKEKKKRKETHETKKQTVKTAAFFREPELHGSNASQQRRRGVS